MKTIHSCHFPALLTIILELEQTTRSGNNEQTTRTIKTMSWLVVYWYIFGVSKLFIQVNLLKTFQEFNEQSTKTFFRFIWIYSSDVHLNVWNNSDNLKKIKKNKIFQSIYSLHEAMHVTAIVSFVCSSSNYLHTSMDWILCFRWIVQCSKCLKTDFSKWFQTCSTSYESIHNQFVVYRTIKLTCIYAKYSRFYPHLLHTQFQRCF